MDSASDTIDDVIGFFVEEEDSDELQFEGPDFDGPDFDGPSFDIHPRFIKPDVATPLEDLDSFAQILEEPRKSQAHVTDVDVDHVHLHG